MTPSDLKKQVAIGEKIVIEATGIRFNPVEEIKKLSGVTGVSLNENILEVNSENAQGNLQDVLFILAKNNVRVHSMNIEEPDLESVFLTLFPQAISLPWSIIPTLSQTTSTSSI